jgi:hypothetical protein
MEPIYKHDQKLAEKQKGKYRYILKKLNDGKFSLRTQSTMEGDSGRLKAGGLGMFTCHGRMHLTTKKTKSSSE